MRYGSWLIVALLAGCGSRTPEKSYNNPPEAPSGIPREAALADNRGSHDRALALIKTHALDELTAPRSAARRELEQLPDAQDALRAIGADEQQPQGTRFAAYEVLLAMGGTIDDAGDRSSAARVYAYELANAASHNTWGLPGGPPSRAFRTLVGLGKDAALPALLPLLDDQRALVYEGSQEPTLSAAFGYRVADLTATMVAALLGTSFPTRERDPAKRDAALASLRSAATAAAP
jgi:hypothetical protein